MKSMKLFGNAACALFLGLVAASCNNNETPDSPTQPDMKRVEFKTLKDVVESETPTDNVQGDKREYLQIVRKQDSLTPVELVQDKSEIYPGSVLRGGDLLETSYSPLVIKDPKEITLSMSLQGPGVKVSTKTLPLISEVRQHVNDLVNDNRDRIDYDNNKTSLSYTAHEVTTIESSNKTFRTHVKVGVLNNLLGVKLKYTYNKETSNTKKYVLVKIRQSFYNISVDPILFEDWGTFVKTGEYEPVYVSSVDYGRVANLLIETNENAESVRKTFETEINLALKKFNVGGGVSTDNKVYKYFKESKVNVLIWGGPLSMGKNVTSYEDLLNFLKKPTPAQLNQSAAPISYTLRSAVDNREIEVKVTYTEANKIFK